MGLPEPGAMGGKSAPEFLGGVYLMGEKEGGEEWGCKCLKRHFVQDWGWENQGDWVLLLGREEDVGNTQHYPCRCALLPTYLVLNKSSG